MSFILRWHMQSEPLDFSTRLQFRGNCYHSMCVPSAAPIDSFPSYMNRFSAYASSQGGRSVVIGQPEWPTANPNGIAGTTCGRQSSHWLRMQSTSNLKGSRESATLGASHAAGGDGARHLPETKPVQERQRSSRSQRWRFLNRPSAHHCVFAHSELS